MHTNVFTNPNEFSVRNATSEDVEFILKGQTAIKEQHYRYPSAQHHFKNEFHCVPTDQLDGPKHGFVIAVMNNEPVGYAAWCGEGINEIYVLPKFSRRGVSQLLLDECCKIIAEHDYGFAISEVWPENKPAILMCAKNGWSLLNVAYKAYTANLYVEANVLAGTVVELTKSEVMQTDISIGTKLMSRYTDWYADSADPTVILGVKKEHTILSAVCCGNYNNISALLAKLCSLAKQFECKSVHLLTTHESSEFESVGLLAHVYHFAKNLIE